MQNPKERPILFSTPMVQAILEGRKTQTRRIIKPQPPSTWSYNHAANSDLLINFSIAIALCPYGDVGDRLWVRETFHHFLVEKPSEYDWNEYESYYVYKADGTQDLKWQPSIHMPRSASRILLGITNVRVERLQNISEEDAIAEGIESAQLPNEETFKHRWKDYQAKHIKAGFSSPIDSYKSLWDSINAKKHPWDSNPWVWVIEFKRL